MMKKPELMSSVFVSRNIKLIVSFLLKINKCLITCLIVVLILLGNRTKLAAQDFSYEIWPEIDLWYKI